MLGRLGERRIDLIKMQHMKLKMNSQYKYYIQINTKYFLTKLNCIRHKILCEYTIR